MKTVSSFALALWFTAIAVSLGEQIAGVGILLERRGADFVVLEVLPGSPADLSKAIERGDKVVAVGQADGAAVDLTPLTPGDTIRLLRGPKGTVVRLHLIRQNETDHRVIQLVRDDLKELESHDHPSNPTPIFPGPPISLHNPRLQQFLDRKKNWMFEAPSIDRNQALESTQAQSPFLGNSDLEEFFHPNKEWRLQIRGADRAKTSKNLFLVHDSRADPPEFDPATERVVEVPIGRLGYRIGTYLTIEGVCAEPGKIDSRSLQMDTLGSRKLQPPVQIWIENVELPAGGRCILSGYESGRWVGVPFEVERLVGLRSQAVWQFESYFLATSIEYYTTAFDSEVSERDKEAIKALCNRVTKGMAMEEDCPHCSTGLRIAMPPDRAEVSCPRGCFHFIGNINPNSGIVVRGVTTSK